jgi:hypothetical protein
MTRPARSLVPKPGHCCRYGLPRRSPGGRRNRGWRLTALAVAAAVALPPQVAAAPTSEVVLGKKISLMPTDLPGWQHQVAMQPATSPLPASGPSFDKSVGGRAFASAHSVLEHSQVFLTAPAPWARP